MTFFLVMAVYGTAVDPQAPKIAGFGIGVERTTRWVAGLKHIRSASLFPRTLSRISP
jgi:aspartyl/asparaginyl-tRNA synthetase